ncbi:MAG: prepilin-type N-terminal cleavage/methylation domain-containing protein [Verrucomicrobiota bacterium]
MTTSSDKKSGFSLHEMVLVLAIIAIVTGFSVSMLSSYTDGLNRRKAVSQVIGLFEKARIEALRCRVPVYVGIAGDDYPSNTLKNKALTLFREKMPSEKNDGNWVALSGWEILPDNVSFTNEPNSLMHARLDTDFIRALPHVKGALHGVMFNETGMIEQPASPKLLNLSLSQEQTKEPHAQSSLGQVKLSRYTGRADWYKSGYLSE